MEGSQAKPRVASKMWERPASSLRLGARKTIGILVVHPQIKLFIQKQE